VGSWVGPWVPFSKLSRQKAIETCEILIEQRDRQIRRAEAAEARLAEVEALADRVRSRMMATATPDEILAAARGEDDR
jgi:hypothetical protein